MLTCSKTTACFCHYRTVNASFRTRESSMPALIYCTVYSIFNRVQDRWLLQQSILFLAQTVTGRMMNSRRLSNPAYLSPHRAVLRKVPNFWDTAEGRERIMSVWVNECRSFICVQQTLQKHQQLWHQSVFAAWRGADITEVSQLHGREFTS